MSLFRKIERLRDINNAGFVVYNHSTDPIVNSVTDLLKCEHRLLRSDDDAIKYLKDSPPDIFFIGPSSDPGGEDCFDLCRSIRSYGYRGVLVLVTHDSMEYGGTSKITSEGFDSYLLSSDSPIRIRDTILWAILNRKRRNKYTILFDDNPDSFYTIDAKGNIYDINKGATAGSQFTPRDVVKRGINVSDIGTLSFFRNTIKPLIISDNIGNVFSHTIEEGTYVHQIKTRVHNVPTMGLVATVIKSDITKTMYSRTMDILLNSVTLLSQRDNYTAAHSSRVFYYCRYIAEELGCSRNIKLMRALCFAALLHDIGKIGIKDNVLLKPGRLTDKEFRELTSHPVKGYKMLQPYKFLHESSDLVRAHHERPDGKGYPDKLKGNRISLGASIIAVADGFDAMTSTRPYRKSMPLDVAITEVKDNLGTQFNEDAGKALLSIITPGLHREIRNASRRPLTSLSQEMIKTLMG
jgi:HD-GYP domain-containing protein (c-di-GMP phosphodiesterase class II)